MNRVKTKNKNEVASYGEARIDNWFWENKWTCVYEPQIVIEDEEFLPDWILWPQHGIDKPVIIEFWGLCRENGKVAEWVVRKRERYMYRKEIKETAYTSCDNYYYLGIYPHHLDDLDTWLSAELQQMITTNSKPVV